MVRTTWMPSVLTEGLFMIVPEQEAALRSPRGQRLYAEAVVEGIRRFLRERALETLGFVPRVVGWPGPWLARGVS